MGIGSDSWSLLCDCGYLITGYRMGRKDPVGPLPARRFGLTFAWPVTTIYLYIRAGLFSRFRNPSFLSPTMSIHHAEAEVDMTQPASSILKTGTLRIHEEVERSKGASYLAKGELDREEYIRFLMMFWHIYKYVFSSILSTF